MNEPISHRKVIALCGLGLGVAIALAYSAAIGDDLFFDDIALLGTHDCWHGIDTIPAMFGFGEGSACTYRPVRWASFAIDYELAGMNPRAFHLSNLLYHLLTALAAYRLLRRWGGPAASLVLLALWSLHPVHADAVAYISGRRDLLTALFFVLAFLQFRPPAHKQLKWRNIALGTLLFLLALRAKEMAVTLPAVLLWAAATKRPEEAAPPKRSLKRWWVYAALILAAGVFTWYRAFADSHSHMAGRWWGGSPTSNFATAFALYARYLQLIVWPSPLIGDYFPVTIPLARDFGDPRALLGVGLYLGLVLLLLVAMRRRWRATAFGLGWFLITMLPVSHIVPHHELFAEHYLYLPMIGLAVAGLPLVERLLSATGPRRLATVVALVVLLTSLGAATGSRSSEYNNGTAFFTAAHERAPRNMRVTFNLALRHLEAGECESAVPMFVIAARYLRRARAISRPNLVRFLNCAESVGEPQIVDSVISELSRRYPNDPLGLAWTGRRYLENERFEESVQPLWRAVRSSNGIEPANVAMLGMALNRLGRFSEALDVLTRYPHEHQGHCEQRVRALMGLGVSQYDHAFRLVMSCLDNWPDSLILLEFRAGLYYSMGDRDSAEEDVRRLEELGAPESDLQRIRVWGTLR